MKELFAEVATLKHRGSTVFSDKAAEGNSSPGGGGAE